MKKNLSERNQAEGQQREQERRKHNFLVREIFPHSPGDEQKSGAGLKHGTGPVLDSTMSSDAKNNEGADSDTQERHGRGFPAAIGISVTSSTQALPLIRLSSFPLRLRTTQTRA